MDGWDRLGHGIWDFGILEGENVAPNLDSINSFVRYVDQIEEPEIGSQSCSQS